MRANDKTRFSLATLLADSTFRPAHNGAARGAAHILKTLFHVGAFLGATVASAEVVGGSITTDTVWSGLIEVTSDIVVQGGVTLTVNAGTVVKAGPSRLIDVRGTLLVEGEADAPVIFTSIRDDSVGGDTNGDGNATSPAFGDWIGLQLSSNASAEARFRHSEIRFAGASNRSAVRVLTGSIEADHLIIRDCALSGVELNNPSSAIRLHHLHHLTILRTGAPGLLVNGAGAEVESDHLTVEDVPGRHVQAVNGGRWSDSNTTFRGAGVQAIVFTGGSTVASHRRWNSPVVYWMVGAVTVSATGRLEVAPGSIIKVNPAVTLTVNGFLNAEGTSEQRVLFTSIHDDSVGGDTNGNGTTTQPAAGDWSRILVNGTGASANFNFAEIRYNGTTSVDSLTVGTTGKLNFANSTIAHGRRSGLGTSGSAEVTIVNSRFEDMARFGLELLNITAGGFAILGNNHIERAIMGAYLYDTRANVVASGTTASESGQANGIQLAGFTVRKNQVWRESLVYVVPSTLTIPVGTTLTLDAGVVIKMAASTSVTVRGSLAGNGTAAQPVLVTSVRDDAARGDTNQDGGATTPAPGDWGRIEFGATSGTATASGNLTHVHVRYAGSGSNHAIEVNRVTGLVIRNCHILDNRNSGIRASQVAAPLSFEGTLIENAAVHGIHIAGTGDFKVDLNRVTVRNSGAEGLNLDVRPEANLANVQLEGSGKSGAILVTAGTTRVLNRAQFWPGPRVYVISGDLVIGRPGSLALDPGVILKFQPLQGLRLDGVLLAPGTEEQPIIFTSIRDDTAGGDTNEDGDTTLPQPGDWFSLWVRDGTTSPRDLARIVAEHLHIFYAGREPPAAGVPALLIDGGVHEFNHLLIDHALDAGFRSRLSPSSHTTLRNATIRNTGFEAINFGERVTVGGGGHVVMENILIENIAGNAINHVLGEVSYTIENLTMRKVTGVNGTQLFGSSVSRPTTIGYTPLVVAPGIISILQGGSLRILPGTVMKFPPRTQFPFDLRVQAGPLICEGTPERPIILTSLADDVLEDTNRDGAATQPQAGDWAGINLQHPSSIRHTEIRYAGRRDVSDGSAINVDFGNPATEFELYGLVIRNTAGHGINIRRGIGRVVNCLLHSFAPPFDGAGPASGISFVRPFAPPEAARIELINNTISGAKRGIQFPADTSFPPIPQRQLVVNNIISGSSQGGIVSFGSGTDTEFLHNILFNPNATDGELSAHYVLLFRAEAGNRIIDPLFANPAAGNFELDAGSPAIDAGFGTLAPKTDLRGFTRFDDPSIADTGAGVPTFVDIGALERLGASDPALNPDLIIVPGSIAVRPPSAGAASVGLASVPNGFVVGGLIEVEWTGRNAGGGLAMEGWRDGVFLSRDRVWDARDIFLGEVSIFDPLGPSEEYTASGTFRIPTLLDGLYHIIVRTDWRNQQFEMRDDNNDGVSANPFAVALALLELRASMAITMTPEFPETTFKVVITEPMPHDLKIVAGTQPLERPLDILVRRGDIPSDFLFDHRNTASPGTPASVQFPLDPGVYYITFRSDNPPPGMDNVFIETELLSLSFARVEPDRVGNGGKATLLIEGARFRPGMEVTLIGPDTVEYKGDPVLIRNSGKMTATFNLLGATPGFYDLLLETDDDALLMDDAVLVVAVTPVGTPPLPLIMVSSPSALRRDPPVSIPISLILVNPTANDIPALIAFEGELDGGILGGEFSLTPDGPTKSKLLILPGGSDSPPGILRPGERMVVDLHYHSTGEQLPGPRPPTGMVCGDAIAIPIDNTPIDYDLDPSLFLHDEFMRRLGSTRADLFEAIQNEATRLRDLGFNEQDGDALIRTVFDEISGKGNNTVSGQLLDENGVPLAGATVAVADSRSQEGFKYTTTTDEDGNFQVDEVVSGEYQVGADGYQFNPAPIRVHGGMNGNGGILAVRQKAAPPPEFSPSRENAPVLLKVEGVPHLFFERSGSIFHTFLPEEDWTNAVEVGAGSGARPLYSPGLFQGQPAIGVFFQQAFGTPPEDPDDAGMPDRNDIRVMLAAARPDGLDGWQWNDPVVAARNDRAASFNPDASLTPDGVPLVAWQMRDFTNPAEDTDLYFRTYEIGPDDINLLSPAALSILHHGVDAGTGSIGEGGPVLMDLCDFVEQQLTCRYTVFDHSFRIPSLGRFGFDLKLGTVLAATLAAAEAGGVVEGELELFGDKKTKSGLFVRPQGTAVGRWVLDRETCQYEFDGLKVSVNVRFRGRTPIPGLSVSFGPLVSLFIGLQVEGEPSGDFIWRSFESLIPDEVTFGGRLALGPYATGEVLFGAATVTLEGLGQVEFSFDNGQMVLNDIQIVLIGTVETLGAFEREYQVTFSGKELGLLGPAALLAQSPNSRVFESADGWRISETVNLRRKPGTSSDYSDGDRAVPLLADVAASLEDESAARLVIGPDGMVNAFWTREPAAADGLNNRILTARFEGAAWTDPEAIPGVTGGNREATPVLDPNGDLLLVFVHADMDGFDLDSDPLEALDGFENSDLHFTRRTAAGWTSPAPVAVIPGNARNAALSKDNGRVFATWVESDGMLDRLFAAEWDVFNRLWLPAQEVSRGRITARAALAEINGLPTVIWGQGVPSTPGAVEAAGEMRLFFSRLQEGAWTEPQELAVQIPDVLEPQAQPSLLAHEVQPQQLDCTAGILQLLNINALISIPLNCCTDEEALAEAKMPKMPSIEEIQDTFGIDKSTSWANIVGGFDPNDKLGAAGYGPGGYIPKALAVPYTIRFENDPEAGATAPALTVRILDQVDPNFDFTTFAFRGYGFASLHRAIPPGVQRFSELVDWHNPDGSPLLVRVTGALDPQSGFIEVIFHSIDPATGLPAAGAFDGFLAIEDGTGVGQGFVDYIVQPKVTLGSGAELRNVAEIIFDTNEAILTPEVLHTIDDEAPVSTVHSPPFVSTRSFTVSWSGSDGNGSGIAAFDIYVSTDGGPFSLWQKKTAEASAVFEGEFGSTYGFYSVAHDHVGFMEQKSPVAETTTVVGQISDIVILGIRLEGDIVRIQFTAPESSAENLALETTSSLGPELPFWERDETAAITHIGSGTFEAVGFAADEQARFFRIVSQGP